MAIDTSGFNLAVPQISVTTPALASLAPLSMPMQGMAWKPADIREPSSAVAEGVASALGSIGKGITAAYQNAQAEKERQRKAGLEERRMQIEEERFAAERSDKAAAIARETEARMKAVGADKFPGESGAVQPGAGAAPTADTTEAAPSPKGFNETGYSEGLIGLEKNFASTGITSPVPSAQPLSFSATYTPPEGAGYLSGQGKLPAQGEPGYVAPKNGVEIVPQPLSEMTPVVPKSETSDIPVLSAGGIPSGARPLQAPPASVFDPFGLYEAEREKVAKMSPKEQEAYWEAQRNLTYRSPDLKNSPIGKTAQAIASSYSNLQDWIHQPTQEARNRRAEEYAKQQKAEKEQETAQKPETTAPTQASYIFPSAPVEQLQEATSADRLRELSPYVVASANVGTGDISTDKPVGAPTAPSLPLSSTNIFTSPKPTYKLDLSQMKKDSEMEAARRSTEQQQPTAQQTPAQPNPFEIPARPAPDQIPKDFTTRDFEAARREQAKDYGFYYEPMGRIETHQDANGQWYKVVRDPEKTSVLEQKFGRLESMRQRYDKYKLQEQNTVDREQTKFYSNPDVKAFTAPNGMRQSFSRFVKDYDAILKNPEASGISDIGLLDMFGRAEGGGRITEGQAALALRAVGILDKPEQLIQKLQGGAKLSQPQRDQMLRVIAEDHAAQANLANQQIEMVRRKLQRQGITDEEMLPQKFIVPITKWEAEDAKKQAKAETTRLLIQRTQAQQSGNKDEVEKINQRMQELKDSIDPIYEMEKRSKGSAIINMHDIEHNPQGWAGGAVTTFQQQGE